MMLRRLCLFLALICLPAAAMAADAAADPFGLSRHRGRVLVVNFWATWCAPCRGEMPALDAYFQRHQGEGLDMLVISMDDPSRALQAREFAGRFHFESAMAADVAIPARYRPTMLPVTLVFDRDSQLRHDSRTTPGLMTDAVLDKVIGPLLANRR